MNRTLVRSCASLFTLLVIGYQGDSSSTSSYTLILSNAFREYEVLKQLMNYATVLSSHVRDNIALSKNAVPSEEDTEIIYVIKSVFNLLYAIADTNDPEIITTLNGVELPQLVVRNPLFKIRASVWSHHSEKEPRGYIFTSNVGAEDPIYGLWLGSMKVLGACVRTSSHWLNVPGSKNIGTGILDMSIEFLNVFKIPLLECLKSCACPSTKMTRLALREAKVLLGLVAELCKRNVRSTFVNSNPDLCEEFLNGSKYIMVGLTKFLGEIGTSSELFVTIEEYEATDQDRIEELRTTSSSSHLRLSLLSEGVQGAKQKAVRLSHFAANRLRRVTQDDFEKFVVVPDNLKILSQENNSDSNWEKLETNCRRSVTNKFSLELVHAAADCVRQALSLITRTHSVSKSFFIFTADDQTKIDFMSLVEPGIVIGYRSHIGRRIRAGDSHNFESFRFGRVLSSNTFSRTWEVSVIRREGTDHFELENEGEQETVSVDQITGIEDKATRKPSTSRLASAPDSIVEFENAPYHLSTGNYILILRWCHQQVALTRDGNALDVGCECPFYVQQIAEQASILLGADLVLHRLNGGLVNKDLKSLSQLDDQLFELFADKAVLLGGNDDDGTHNIENEQPSTTMASSWPSSLSEGRLKNVINPIVWNGIQCQVRPFVQRSWTRQKELLRKRNEKRLHNSSGGGFNDFSWGSLGSSRPRSSSFSKSKRSSFH